MITLDQLHEKLTNRFIDSSATYFVGGKKNLSLDIKINEDKSIV